MARVETLVEEQIDESMTLFLQSLVVRPGTILKQNKNLENYKRRYPWK